MRDPPSRGWADDVPGPNRPLGKMTGAAAQLRQTGHSCIMQHS